MTRFEVPAWTNDEERRLREFYDKPVWRDGFLAELECMIGYRISTPVSWRHSATIRAKSASNSTTQIVTVTSNTERYPVYQATPVQPHPPDRSMTDETTSLIHAPMPSTLSSSRSLESFERFQNQTYGSAILHDRTNAHFGNTITSERHQHDHYHAAEKKKPSQWTAFFTGVSAGAVLIASDKIISEGLSQPMLATNVPVYSSEIAAIGTTRTNEDPSLCMPPHSAESHYCYNTSADSWSKRENYAPSATTYKGNSRLPRRSTSLQSAQIVRSKSERINSPEACDIVDNSAPQDAKRWFRPNRDIRKPLLRDSDTDEAANLRLRRHLARYERQQHDLGRHRSLNRT